MSANVEFDGKINIATGISAGSRSWKNKDVYWSKLVKKLSTENKTHETLKEFLNATKKEQGKIKDVGGYVGGYLRGGRRLQTNVVHRQLITLDVDFASEDFWNDFVDLYGNAALVHGTHKYTPEAPRLRLVMPLNREVTPDEYVAISRRIAGDLGIDMFDATTFDIHRLMFWVSNPIDIDHYFEFQDGEWLDADEVLGSYIDWRDSSLWPTSGEEIKKVGDAAKKLKDPETKNGIVGSFCRTYDIKSAIEAFLPDVYEPTAHDDRFTYANGTAAAGLVVYDDKFAYSHHGTDPCGNKLVNAFDLVRIHKFGHLDSGNVAEIVNTKSYKNMDAFARSDGGVKKTISGELMANVKYDFQGLIEEEDDEAVSEVREKSTEDGTTDEALSDFEDLIGDEAKEAPKKPKSKKAKTAPEDDKEWMGMLEYDNKNKIVSSASNINIIFANDPLLKKKFRGNVFDEKDYIFGSVPWRKIGSFDQFKDVDFAGTRNYIETVYGVSGVQKIDDVLTLEFHKNKYHPIQDYLNGLEWDGEERIGDVLIDYFGAEDNAYTREAMLKMMVGAVARIFRPGIKFELVLTLVGEQGVGKSTLFNKLGRAWFSDSFTTVQGKEAYEQLQGAWIIEMAELSGLRKAEVETIKHFISKQEDTYRKAFGHVVETHKRQGIFVGTTNTPEFLHDTSGNRRFMPIQSNTSEITKDIFSEFDEEVDQLWAEAVAKWRSGEKLFLSREAEIIAGGVRDAHSEKDERIGIIEKYLNTPVPGDWAEMDMYARRDYVAAFENTEDAPDGAYLRDSITVAEIWCECLGKEKENMDRYKTRELNNLVKQVKGWSASGKAKTSKYYGKQRYFTRE